MINTLLDFKIKKCTDFSQKLVFLKSALNNTKTENLENAMNDLHTTFLVFLNSFEIKPEPILKIQKETPKNQIETVKINQFSFLCYQGLIVDIDQSYSELGKFFINKNIDEVADQINSFWDYENRNCDSCGLYFSKISHETPTIRIKKSDFVLAFHENCSNKNI